MPALTSVPEIYSLAVKRILLNWLQEFFAGRADFNYKFGDDRDTGIRIVDKHSFNLASVTDKPAIVLDRKQLRRMNASLDNNFGMYGLRAAQAFSDLQQCGIVLHCMCKEGLVAENLAHIVYFGVESFRRDLRRRGLWDVTATAVGEESIIVSKAGTEIVSVPVALNVFLSATWLRRRASTQLVQDVELVQNP